MLKPRPYTEAEKVAYKKKIGLYKYYGIPYLVFDNGKRETKEQIEKDRMLAVRLIETGKKIPDDLGKRLLKYKADDEQRKAMTRQ